MLRVLIVSLFVFLPYAPSRTEAGESHALAGPDVLVVGSEPEGVMAAVAAAETGARTVLVTRDARVGGLFVLGELNMLDLRGETRLQRGLFERWWTRVGGHSAFDVARAENVFSEMLAEAGVMVRLETGSLEPLVQSGRVIGMRSDAGTLYAEQVIDATADGDLAAAAGVPFTLGFSSLGLEERMADTLIFRLHGVNWQELALDIRARGPTYAQIDARAAWGAFGGYPAAYPAQQPGVRLRGLNLGRQDDGSVLVNALLLYGPYGRQERALARGRLELPHIVRYLRGLPGLGGATLAGSAEQLYVRESRHFATRCRLTVDDVLDNRVTGDAVAAGGYPLDVQTLTPEDNGYVYGVPEVYGLRLCVSLPQHLDNLWIVGKTAGYDPLAASSARVVPLGMALGEAVGVAAATSSAAGIGAHAFAENPSHLQALRTLLEARGAYLPPVVARTPTGPHRHPAYGAYRTLLRRGLALGGYTNDPRLDETMPGEGFLNLLTHVGQRFWGNTELRETLERAFPELSPTLTPAVAHALTHYASRTLGVSAEAPALPPRDLTRGDAYRLAAALAQGSRE